MINISRDFIGKEDYMIDKKGKIILIIGATGQQGGAVIEVLLKNKWEVKAFSRGYSSEALNNLKHKGVKVSLGDLNEHESLVEAMKGAYGVFGMSTSFEKGIEGEKNMGKTLVDAAKATGIKHFVFSSVAASDRNTGIPHFESKHEIELYIVNSGIPYTIFRPVSFMLNYMRLETRESILKGVFRAPYPPEKKLQLLALEDLGAFVNMAFENPDEYLGKNIELASEELTQQEIANVFSRVLGRAVHYEQFPLEAIKKQSMDMYLMMKWLNDYGYTADINNLRKLYPELMNFEEWLYKHGWAKLKEEKAG